MIIIMRAPNNLVNFANKLSKLMKVKENKLLKLLWVYLVISDSLLFFWSQARWSLYYNWLITFSQNTLLKYNLKFPIRYLWNNFPIGKIVTSIMMLAKTLIVGMALKTISNLLPILSQNLITPFYMFYSSKP